MNSFVFKVFIFTFLTSKFKIVFSLNKTEQMSCKNSVLLAYPELNYYLNTTTNGPHPNNDFDTYTQHQLLNVITNSIQNEFCSGGSFLEVNTTLWKNYTDKYANVSSEKFCRGVNQTIIVSEKPPSVSFFLEAMKNNSRCAFICTKNLKNELMITCPLVLSLYTDRSTSDSKINNKTNVLEESKNRELKPNEVNEVESASKTTLELNKNRNVETGNKKNDEPDKEKSSEPINAEAPSKNAQPPSLSKDDGESSPDEPPENRNNLSSQVPNLMKSNLDEESHLFIYFVLLSILCIGFYALMYNKKKILALMIEGRRRNSRRRPNTAAYSKLDCNLEEAMSCGPSTSTTNTLLY